MAFFPPLLTFPSNPNVSLGPFGFRGKGGRAKESRIEFAENKLILNKLYSTLLSLPPPQSKQTIRFLGFVILRKSYRVFLEDFSSRSWPIRRVLYVET